MASASVTHTTMMERAYRHIRAGLATGEFQPGAQISEQEIAEKVGVGRTPVREALVVLGSQGFVEQVPRYGTFVRKAERHERQSMYELREVLEAYAAGKAATDMSPAGVKLLGDLSEMTRQVAVGVRESKSGVTDELLSKAVTADLAFHMVILRESGNPFVIKIVSDLHLMGRIWGGDRNDPMSSDLGLWAKTWKQHNRIYRAIRRRDAAQASYWMTEHLRDATREALAYYDRQCRMRGADQAGFEWPQAVRDAISRLEQFGPENLT